MSSHKPRPTKFRFIELFGGGKTIDLTVDAMLRIAQNGSFDSAALRSG